VPPIGEANLNSPNAIIYPVLGSRYKGPNAEFMAEHTGMTANPDVIRTILNFFADSPTGGQTIQPLTLEEPAPVVDSYEILVAGFDSVIVSNDLGESFDAMTSSGSPLMDASNYVAGARARQLVLRGDISYELLLRSDGTPGLMELTRKSSGEIVEAVRYRDLSLPMGEVVFLTLESDVTPVLMRDVDKDGSFETDIEPTVSLSGPGAQDTTPPSIDISVSGSEISVQAYDPESGVKALYASYDGRSFFPYTKPLSRALIQRDQLHLMADDNAGNRAVYDPILTGDPNRRR